MKEKTVDLEQGSDGTYQEAKISNHKIRQSNNRNHHILSSNSYIPLGNVFNSFIRANVSINKRALTPIAFGLAALGFIAGISKTIQRGKRSRLR